MVNLVMVLASKVQWHPSLCDIVICKAVIPERYWKRYSDLYKANTEHQEANKYSSDSIEDSVARQQNSAVGNLLRKRGNLGVVSVQQSLFGTPSSTASHLSFAGGASTTSTSYTSVRGRAPSQMMSTINMDFRKSKNATIEMAIADFFHC
jgi:hypothetical protein